MQFTGFRACGCLAERLIPSALLASSASATRINSGIMVAWPLRSLLSWLFFSIRLYSRIQRGRANIIITVKIGYNDLGYNDKSPITTKFLCQQQNCVHLCTKTIGYNDIANNDKSQITTEFRCPVP